MTEKVQSFNLITDFSEIESRQNYVEKFTIKRGEQVEAILKDLIGYYLFKEQVKCGISSCGTKHQKGYIASLQNGKEIIIGHNCGKRYFGMSFDEKSNQFEHLRNNAYQYSVVKERFQQLDELKAKYDQILNKSGKLGFVKIKQAISDFQGVAFDYYMRKVIQKEVSYNGVIRKEEFKTIEEM
ncbi:hypothetical protein JKI98_10575, partial [Acinetobacter nectaris]|nr:hypothetical protein [Acinetobacter nectaris]